MEVQLQGSSTFICLHVCMRYECNYYNLDGFTLIKAEFRLQQTNRVYHNNRVEIYLYSFCIFRVSLLTAI
jgi:hypothetical protein